MYLCIDIGGTKTLLALMRHDGKLLHSARFATNHDQAAFYKNLLQQISLNFATSKLRALSVAVPGLVSRGQLGQLGNLPWHNFALKTLLSQDFHLPIYLENDAKLATLAEARRQTGRSLYLTLSTGIGGNVAENGQLLPHFRHFEPGHDRYVYQGKSKEWEDLVSAAAIRQHFGKLVDELNDPAAWRLVTERLLLGLVPLITAIKPDRIIFGGPLGLALNHYRIPLRHALKSALPKTVKIPRLLRAKYQDFSVIYGCYFYAKSQSTHH